MGGSSTLTKNDSAPAPAADPAAPGSTAPAGNGAAPVSYTREGLSSASILDLLTDDDLKKDPSLATFKGIDGLARSYVSTKKLVGADHSAFVKIPTDATPAEELDKFYNTLGRPETPDQYVIPEQVVANKEKLMIKDETLAGFGAVAHAAGLSNTQFQKVVDWYGEFSAKEMESIATEFEGSVAQSAQALRTEWGEKYDQNIQLSKAAVRALAKQDDTIMDLLETPFLVGKSRLGDDPRMIRLFARIGAGLREDEIKDGRAGTGASFESRKTPAEALAEVSALKADREFMARWMDAKHPGHADSVRRMDRLMEQAYPEPTK